MATQSFQTAALFVIGQEAGLFNDPAGGLTNYGIAQKAHPELTADDIRHMTIGKAMDIYRESYWNKFEGDKLPPAAAFVMLDAAINEGVGTAIEMMQRALGIRPVDGVIGPVTIDGIGHAPIRTMLPYFTAERILRYSTDSDWAVDGRGWVRRAVTAAIQASQVE